MKRGFPKMPIPRPSGGLDTSLRAAFDPHQEGQGITVADLVPYRSCGIGKSVKDEPLLETSLKSAFQ